MNEKRIPPLPCMCATLRRTSRGITQLYEAALRPTGLRASQFTILQVLSEAGALSQGELGNILVMDSTSLTRTLAIMERNGWIEKRPGTDRREWRLHISRAGRQQLQRALPHWERLQARLHTALGQRWEEFTDIISQVTAAVAAQGGEIS